MKCKSIIICIIFSLFSHLAFSQTFLFQNLPSDRLQFGLRFLRPNFERDADLSLLSGCYDFSCHFPMSQTTSFYGSLPITTFSAKGDDSETGLGNICLGVQKKHRHSTTHQSCTSLAVFLPTASEKKYSVFYMGIYTNHYEWHKYIPNTLTIYGNYSYHIIKPAGFMFGIEIGPNLWIPTKGKDREFELLGHYGIKAGFQTANLAVFTELVGLAIITEDIEDANNRFIHAIGFCAQLNQKIIRPGIFYQKYLKEDLDRYVTGVLGLKLDISL